MSRPLKGEYRAAPKRRWQVFAKLYPMHTDGSSMTEGSKAYARDNGWYWIQRRGEISLRVKVHGLGEAQYIARKLTEAQA